MNLMALGSSSPSEGDAFSMASIRFEHPQALGILMLFLGFVGIWRDLVLGVLGQVVQQVVHLWVLHHRHPAVFVELQVLWGPAGGWGRHSVGDGGGA